MAEDSTILEDYLSAVELLPNDIRRDFELMKEHDKECYDGVRELNQLEKPFLDKLKENKQNVKEFAANPQNKAMYGEIKGVYHRVLQRSSQKTALASNMINDLEKFIRKLDADLVVFENELRGCGAFEQISRGLEVGSEVAVKVPMVSGFEVILGRVIFYHSDIGVYDVADIDDSKRYQVAENQLILLDLAYSIKKLSKGEEVLAVYPDTTSFYPAVVTQAAKRNLNSSEPSVIVQFRGDEDDQGQTPNIVVALNHIIRPPDDWLYR